MKGKDKEEREERRTYKRKMSDERSRE